MWVAPEYEQGFGYEPDAAVIEAAAAMLVAAAIGFDAELTAARALATADEASKLSRPKRAELASAVQVTWPGRPGYVAQMSASTYSKRVRVGRATDDEVIAFLMACDTPSLDKLYVALPKAAHLAKPKTRKPAATPEVTPEPEVSEPETPPTVTDADIPKIAADVLAGLTTRGLTRAQVSLLISELDRLTTPVRSVA